MTNELENQVKKYARQYKNASEKLNKIEQDFKHNIINPLFEAKDFDTLLELFENIPEGYNKFILFQMLRDSGILKVD